MKNPFAVSAQMILLAIVFAVATVSWASTQNQPTTSTLPAAKAKPAKHHASTHLYRGNLPVGVRMRIDHETSDGATVVDMRKEVYRGRTVFQATLIKKGETSVITMDSPGDIIKRVVVSKPEPAQPKAEPSKAESPTTDKLKAGSEQK